MPKLKRKAKTKAKTKAVAKAAAPVKQKKSERDIALEEYRADPSYTRYDNHCKEAEVCAITGVSYKTQSISYVQAMDFRGWCCLDAATRFLQGKSYQDIKDELLVKFRPKSPLTKLKRKLRA